MMQETGAGKLGSDTRLEGDVGTDGETVRTEADGDEGRLLDPVMPGEILLEEFMVPLGLTKYRLAKAIHVPQTRIGEIIAGKRRITADTDLRLCRYFGLSEGYWQRLQVLHDTRIARRELERELDAIEPHPLSETEAGVLARLEEVPEFDDESGAAASLRIWDEGLIPAP